MDLSAATFREHLFRAPSASEALESWCRRHWHLQARLEARTRPLAAPPAPDAGSPLAGQDPPHYRRADLLYGGQVVSEAEMWYLPGALSPAMRQELRQARTPFGRAVEALGARRALLREGPVTPPPERGFSPPDAFFLQLHLVLRTPEGRVFAEVREHYRRALLQARG